MRRLRQTNWTVLLVLAVVGSFVLAGLSGCSGMSKTKKGAGIGAAAGAAAGAIIGHQSGNKGKGAVIGGAAGAVVGGVIGHYMDKQAEELAAIEGAQTERVGDGIRVTWDSAILFDFDKAVLKPQSKANIDQMGEIFAKYPDTEIVIAGHTDNVGTDAYNRDLSYQRAGGVRDYLVNAKGIEFGRISVVGHGESQPVADNTTAEGRQMNRRVEIVIRPNEDLRKRAAEEEQG